jgi:hypothetical protein
MVLLGFCLVVGAYFGIGCYLAYRDQVAAIVSYHRLMLTIPKHQKYNYTEPTVDGFNMLLNAAIWPVLLFSGGFVRGLKWLEQRIHSSAERQLVPDRIRKELEGS